MIYIPWALSWLDDFSCGSIRNLEFVSAHPDFCWELKWLCVLVNKWISAGLLLHRNLHNAPIKAFVVKVESLFEDEDFRTKVTREQFEDLCQDLVDRIDKVIKDALAASELSVVRFTSSAAEVKWADCNLSLP